MRSSSVSPALLLAASVLFAPSVARAQFTTYSSLSSFTAALSTTGTDSFDDMPQQTFTPTPIVRAAGGFGYTASAASGFFSVGPVGDVWLSTGNFDEIITFNNFLPTVRGIGGFFFGTDFDGAFVPGQRISLVATDANGVNTVSLISTTTSMFFGFISAGAISSLTVTAPQPDLETFNFPTVNNLVLGSGLPSTSVPEPRSFALVAAGLAAVLLLSRRHCYATFVPPTE